MQQHKRQNKTNTMLEDASMKIIQHRSNETKIVDVQ